MICPGCGQEFIGTDRFHACDSFVIYDLETTGLYPEHDGAIVVEVV